jgi:predicted enzyme related to lactoylglutathione lyase
MASRDLAILTFTKLVVGDLDKSAAFYEAVCGYERGQVVASTLDGRAFREMIYQTASGARGLILMAYDAGSTPNAGPVLGFYTEDIAGVRERVLAHGGSVVEDVRPLKWGDTPMKIAYFADHEGHVLEVIQR